MADTHRESLFPSRESFETVDGGVPFPDSFNPADIVVPAEPFPPIPQGVYGVCEGCGAVAWELLNGRSTLCIGCAPYAYRDDDESEDCGSCGCVGACKYDGER